MARKNAQGRPPVKFGKRVPVGFTLKPATARMLRLVAQSRSMTRSALVEEILSKNLSKMVIKG